MPRIHEMIESRFLRKEDVGNGLLVTVTACDQQNLALEDQPADMQWCLHFQETKKPLVLKPTNLQLCAIAFNSDNSDDWMGKKLVLYTDPTISFGGKIVGGIRVRAPRNQPAAAPQPPVQQQQKAPAGTFDDLVDDIPFADPYRGRLSLVV